MSLEHPVAPPLVPNPAFSSPSTAPMAAATSLASAPALPATSTDPAESTNAIPSTAIMTSPPSADGVQAMSPVSASASSDPETKEDPNTEVDPQIMEALKSKDRLFVLRVGELMESLINERKPRIELAPSTSYQRLLVHRCSAYYKVSPENDAVTKAIVVHSTIESRIPARRIAELVPAESTKPPAFQIMRRTPGDRMRSKPTSRTGSVGGEDVELSDGEPSEGGSNGSRSHTKKHLTIEEREAAYNEARSRIFMNFEEKAKEKENDMSASSSTFSLVSGSASTSGGGSSSAGDIDDSISTAATESEWSGPATRDKRDNRRNGSGANSARSSSRSLRSVHASSSRNSRAPSPSFTYASIYEPPATMPYDASQGTGQAPQAYLPYMYPYPPPGQPLQQGYMQPYPYLPPYPYMANSDPGSPTSEGLYAQGHGQPSQQVPFINAHYMWPPVPGAPQGTHSAGPSPAPGGAYHQYGTAAPYGPYAMAGYYPPLNPHAQPHIPPMPNQGQAMYPAEPQAQMNGNGGAMSNGEGAGSAFRRPQARSSTNGSSSSIGSQGRRQAPGAKGAWSYGPGVSLGGYQIPGMSAVGGVPNTMGLGAGENAGAVGPRLSNSRRTSGNSSGSAGAKTPGGDEASSVASSTSSSSRRTYTSTTSSQHPLPARPDWAVGLKAQPTLHATHSHNRNHDHSNNHSRTMSPAQNVARLPHGSTSAPVVLQSADFPPLTSLASTPEKRAPVPNGAWNKPPNRPFQLASPGQQASYSNVLAQAQAGANGHPGPASANANANLGASVSRLDDADKAFERPPPKGNAELFNPKDKAPPQQQQQQDALVEKMDGLTVGAEGVEASAGQPTPDGASNGRP
ncbi:hypothetical protein DENSPDRAFT_834535 [Dentipellis sp. KUC8613]|nr:hypothetical protein DENSPDRAFT_834535 [Dentipellis sp. KUC8613]